MNNLKSFTEALKEATDQILEKYSNAFVMGLGVTYKGGADGTIGEDLQTKYPNRVFDTPNSEFCTNGVCVGAAITGMRPIIHHSRVEFGLFGIDQITTQAAKWNYMFGGDNKVPVVFRLNIGRQWGNGPQHTQALYSLFGSVAGLKVVVPSTPYYAKGLLTAAVKDNNPVVFLEPRWCYGLKENVPSEYYELPLDKARYIKKGDDLTLVCYGDGVIEAIKSAQILEERGISVEIIDLVSVNPVDYDTVYESVKKTGRLFCLDMCPDMFSLGGDIISKVCLNYFDVLKQAPEQLTTPNTACPTSPSLIEAYYPTYVKLINSVLKMFKMEPSFVKDLSFDEINILPKFEVKPL